MKALERDSDIRDMAATWQKAFRQGADVIGKMDGNDVLWHGRLGIWGAFSKTRGKANIIRDWNPFGRHPRDFRSNMIVEINQPPSGIDRNIQAVFARDERGKNWLLRQGRMSVTGMRVTEADFIAATGLEPTTVTFSDGSTGEYHKVANLSAPAAVVQQNLAAFVAHCARARLVKLANGEQLADLAHIHEWEHGLSPEVTGDFDIAPRDGAKGSRVHGEIWKVLQAELKSRGVPHSNDRVAQYGPDLYTFGTGPKVLFEIKSRCGAHDIFEGVGQLHIYERLLGKSYRKVLVVPEGMRKALEGPLSNLKIDTVEFRRQGGKIVLDPAALTECLR